MQTLLSNLEETSVRKKKIVLKTLERVYAVSSSEIMRFEADGSYATGYLADGQKVVVSRQLKEFEALLNDCGFLRVHQSHLINMEFFFCYEKADSVVIMKDNAIIPVATRKKELLLKFMNEE
jgi:two-component system LytT family response regulator